MISLPADQFPSTSKDLKPINTIYPDIQGKKINIGGRLVEWEAVIDFLKSLDLELVPNINNTSKSDNVKYVKKKASSRELQNLQFGINYDKPIKAKGKSEDQ